MYEDNYTALALIEKQMPNLNKHDINMLVQNLIELSSEIRNQILASSEPVKLDQWIPSPKTIKEVIMGGVRVIDMKYCIEDFQQFALTRGWKLKDNLDAKFIAHVNIMVSKSKITLTNSEKLASQQ